MKTLIHRKENGKIRALVVTYIVTEQQKKKPPTTVCELLETEEQIC